MKTTEKANIVYIKKIALAQQSLIASNLSPVAG